MVMDILSQMENDILEDALVSAKFKFMLHRRKGGWRHKDKDVLMTELKREVKELQEAKSKEAIISECGDIINYAAMLIDNVKRGM
jgi:hypothetical protein